MGFSAITIKQKHKEKFWVVTIRTNPPEIRNTGHVYSIPRQAVNTAGAKPGTSAFLSTRR